MSAIQRAKHAVPVSVGWRGSNATDGGLVLVAFLDAPGLVFFRGISDDRSVGAQHTTRSAIVASRGLGHLGAGLVESIVAEARAPISTMTLLATAHGSRLGAQCPLARFVSGGSRRGTDAPPDTRRGTAPTP